MLLGYKKGFGDSDSYHYGLVDGKEFQFIRVIAGVALPILDRVKGAVVVVGEQYHPGQIPAWTGIDVVTGEWPQVENALGQFRKDYKFTEMIVDREVNRKMLWGLRSVYYGMTDVPVGTVAAPIYAASEIGRSYVDQLFSDRRLNFSEVLLNEMEMEPEMSALALRYAMCWMKEYLAHYKPVQKGNPRQGARILGTVGLE